MTTLSPDSLISLRRPAWLSRLYAYVGADGSAHRYENERDRAFQRSALPTFLSAGFFVLHDLVGTPVRLSEAI